MNKSIPPLLLIAAAAAVCTVPAQAAVLTFEDLQADCDAHPQPYPLPGGGTATPYSVAVGSGYGGLNWNNFYAVDARANAAYFNQAATGDVNGLVSGSIDLFNGYGTPASVMETTTPIVLHSAYLTGGWNNGLVVQADGYLGGVLQYSKTVTVSAYHPTFVSYEFSEVDKVVWTSSGGTPVGWGGAGTQFVMDDLSYDLVPEPSVSALLCGAGGLIGLLRRAKRNS